MANNSSNPLKPLYMASCMEELDSFISLPQNKDDIIQYIKRRANSLPYLAEQLLDADAERDEEKYYVYGTCYLLAYHEVFHEKELLRHEMEQTWWNLLPNAKSVVKKLERIMASLKSRYEALNKKPPPGFADSSVDSLKDQKKGGMGASGTETNEEDRLCIVCMDCVSDHVFVPCRHSNTCGKCADKLVNCPLCRQLIQSKIKVY